jgi:hypothetical protein
MDLERVGAPPGGMRLLLVLNELEPGSHCDWRESLSRLRDGGALCEYSVYPYLARRADGLSEDEVAAEVLEAAESVRANAILLAHTHGLRLPRRAHESLRDNGVKVSAYWDGDWYHPFHSPFPRETLDLVGRCDMAFVCGEGYLQRLFAKRGCRDVHYVPSTADPRFAGMPALTAPEFDVVMIGNHITSRVPFKSMPGSVFRAQVVETLGRRFGSSFAVFGTGWRGPNAQGPVPYEDQTKAYQLGRCAVGCNNWFVRYYFSDRLPIAMLSRVPTAYFFGEGYERVLGADSGVYWYTGVGDVLAATERALTDGPDSDGTVRAARVASTRFMKCDSLAYMLAAMDARRMQKGGLESRKVTNPWLESCSPEVSGGEVGRCG